MKYTHTNIAARDWKLLSEFYIKVFKCTPVPPERHLAGEWVDRLTTLKGAGIDGVHLRLPGYDDGPTLEIFSYNPSDFRTSTGGINRQGFGHIAFLVDSVEDVLKDLLKNGGSQLGEIVVNEYKELGTLTAVYAADPEGNYVEIQNWKKNIHAGS